MKRNIIAVICLMLAASVLLASCAMGKKYITDSNGETHVLYTDENGETVTDRNGSVIVVKTDEKGKAVTDVGGNTEVYTVPPAHIDVDASGKKVDCSAYSMTVPDGWVLSSNNRDIAQLLYGDEDSEIKMEIRYVTKEYDATLEETREFMKSFFVDRVEKVIIDEEEEIKLKDGEISPVTKITFLGAATKNGEKVTAGLIVYIFRVGNYTYTVPCNIFSEEDIKNIDFESVLNAINYKQ